MYATANMFMSGTSREHTSNPNKNFSFNARTNAPEIKSTVYDPVLTVPTYPSLSFAPNPDGGFGDSKLNIPVLPTLKKKGPDEQNPHGIVSPLMSNPVLTEKKQVSQKQGSLPNTSDSHEPINIANPKVWGPPFWFSLHTSASFYPEHPSEIVKERMKGRILAIPYEIPCSMCRSHAITFVEARRGELDDVVSTRMGLVKFYTDFHNQVNKRYGKPEWSYEKVDRFYSGK